MKTWISLLIFTICSASADPRFSTIIIAQGTNTLTIGANETARVVSVRDEQNTFPQGVSTGGNFWFTITKDGHEFRFFAQEVANSLTYKVPIIIEGPATFQLA